MTFIEKVKEMLGFGNAKAKDTYAGPEISRAIQRNEMAQTEARKALEQLKDNGGISTTIREIAGKMK